jgi:hypothetical protein
MHRHDLKFKICNFYYHMNFKLFIQVVFYNEVLQIFKWRDE